MPVSIRSIGYAVAELAAVLPQGWSVQPQRPFRLRATWSPRG